MNGPYFRERFNTSDSDEKTDKDSDSPVVNSNPFADRVPVDPALIHETPMGGTLAAVDPLNDPLAEEVPMYETPAPEIPMGGTLSAVSPLDEPPAVEPTRYRTPSPEIPMGGTFAPVGPLGQTIVHEAPMDAAIPYKAPMGETITHEAPIGTTAGSPAALLNREESEHFRARWNDIQGKFVDEPRAAVQQADALVSEVIDRITHMFANERGSLEGQWNRDNDVSTEDLRKALQRYRSFFNRLVV